MQSGSTDKQKYKQAWIYGTPASQAGSPTLLTFYGIYINMVALQYVHLNYENETDENYFT